MAARTNSQFLFASLTEFISVWGQGVEASLNLTTSAGMAQVNLNCTLGHPGAPFSFPPFPFPSPLVLLLPFLADRDIGDLRKRTRTASELPATRQPGHLLLQFLLQCLLQCWSQNLFQYQPQDLFQYWLQHLFQNWPQNQFQCWRQNLLQSSFQCKLQWLLQFILQ